MLPEDEVLVRYYSLGGLHERLREDAALNPDTMGQRFGAWAQLSPCSGSFTTGRDTAPCGCRHVAACCSIRTASPSSKVAPRPSRASRGDGRATRSDGNVFLALEKLLCLTANASDTGRWT